MVAPTTPRQPSQIVAAVRQHEHVLRVTKQVRFPPKSSSLQNIRPTIHLKDYSSAERFNSFYASEEWHDMKVNVLELLSLLANGQIDARDACIRGLDKLYGERHKMVRIVRTKIVDAVMDVQEEVWRGGMDNDWDALADAARTISINADREAIQAAWDDMESAKQAYSRKFLATCPHAGEPSQQPCRGDGPQSILKRSETCTLPPSSFLLKESKRTRSNSQSILTIRTARERQKAPSVQRRDSSSTSQTKSTTLIDNSRHSRRSVSRGGLNGESVSNSPPSRQPRPRSGGSDMADDPSPKPRRRSDPFPVQVGNDQSLTASPVSRSSSGSTGSGSAMNRSTPSPSTTTTGISSTIRDTHSKKTTIHRGDRPPSNHLSVIVSSPKSTNVYQSTATNNILTRSSVSPKPNGRLMVLHSPSQSKPREDRSPPPSETDRYRKHTTLPRSPPPSQMFAGSRRTLSVAASLRLPPGPCLVDAAYISSRRTNA